MYLLSHHLKNIACFEDVALDFTDENGEPCKWVTIIGENATGKSTVLRTIAFGLDYKTGSLRFGGAFSLKTLPRIISDNPLIPNYNSNFETRIRVGTAEIGSEAGKEHIVGATYVSGGPLSLIGSFTEKAADTVINEHLHGDKVSDGWFAAGYRPGRSRIQVAIHPSIDQRSRSRTVRFASLFNFDGYLPDISEWLWDLDSRVNYATVKRASPDVISGAQRLYDLAVRCIVAILP